MFRPFELIFNCFFHVLFDLNDGASDLLEGTMARWSLGKSGSPAVEAGRFIFQQSLKRLPSDTELTRSREMNWNKRK